ncbi:hypothetical protein GEMRC1_013244 [Eukaryota sp. GEM-RC1]
MSFCFLPTETLSSLLNEPCFSDQTIFFGEESIKVNKSILALHSTYFRSLWYMDFADKHENPIDFSHLPIDVISFFSFIKSFYGKSFILTEDNAYHFYYLAHYFQVDKLIQHVENHLNTHLVTWAWLKPFIKEADERNDLRALQFVGPFLSKIDDLLIDDVMVITTEGFKILSEYCTCTQSLTWFIKSFVESILNQSFYLSEFLNILNCCSIEALSFLQWDEFLFVPLKDVEELKSDLMKFLFTRVKNLCVNSLVKENSDLKEQNSNTTIIISDLESHGLNSAVVQSQLVSQSVYQSKMIKFSQSKMSSLLQLSEDQKRVIVGSGSNQWRNILGEDPLLLGNAYTWKLRYQGTTDSLYVGVIDESKFSVGSWCYSQGHCLSIGGSVYGCLSGNAVQWNPGEVLEINVNLIIHTLTIKSVGDSSINLTGTLPRLSSGNYCLFASLYYSDHVLEIVE